MCLASHLVLPFMLLFFKLPFYHPMRVSLIISKATRSSPCINFYLCIKKLPNCYSQYLVATHTPVTFTWVLIINSFVNWTKKLNQISSLLSAYQ